MNLFYSFGCYLMSLTFLNSYVLRKLLDFLNLSIFYIILVIILFILSNYSSTFAPYRKETKFSVDCFNIRFSCFWYCEFSYKIF